MGGQEIKIGKSYQLVAYYIKKMRGFQIWPHSSNRKTFDPLFAKKKLSKISKIPNLANFRQFFWPNRTQMLSDLNSEARIGILRSFLI